MDSKSNNKKDKMQEVFNRVVENVQNIVNSGEYEKLLKFRKNFRNYSFNNIVLIYSQFEEATRVAGRTKWKSMKREVKDGAKKIYIIAPIPKYYEKKVKKIENGEEIEVIEKEKYFWYTSAYVYDISQTYGEDIPMQDGPVIGENIDVFYEKLKAFSRFSIIEEEMYGTTQGYYSDKKQIIALKKGLDINQKTAVLLHELAHGLYDDFDYKKDRNLSEVFVESIAYMVADYFGLDTSMCSFNYITDWANGDPKTVIELGTKIQKCANEFIDEIENFEIQEQVIAA